MKLFDMPFKIHFNIWLMISWIVQLTSGLSFNQPKFCPIVSWQINGTTFANNTILGFRPLGLFIDNNNTIYATDRTNNLLRVWSEGSSTPTRTISHDLNQPVSIFVTNNGDIYIDNGEINRRVDKWTRNSTIGVPVMFVGGSCYGLFVDSNNSLYCSIQSQHVVVKLSLGDNPNMTMIAAGNGSYGATSNTLYSPTGIYVDTNFDLYVADMGNGRIQLFKSGQTNGITLTTITSTGIMVNGNGYLFFVDRLSHSIIRSGPNGYHCVIGCSGTSGNYSYQLNLPYNLAFDSHGNMFIMDENNHRIQKFILTRNSCISYNQPRICPNATWNTNATTFTDNGTIGGTPRGFFIDSNDSIYVVAYPKKNILIWSNSSNNFVRNLSVTLFRYTTVFITLYGDMYFENGNKTGRIDQWKQNASGSELVFRFNGSCYGLFIDINNNLYCSMLHQHQVVSISLNNNTNTLNSMRGDGRNGSASNQLNQPWGIFVDTNFDLYVADCLNHRIQLFRLGELNAITVAGNGTPNNLILNSPTDVILDADGYVFIADNVNNRIIRVGLTNFYCVAGCSNSNGLAPNQLYKAYSLRFDSDANIYVADEFNYRIQKFMLQTNYCVETLPTTALTSDPLVGRSSTIQNQDTSQYEHNSTIISVDTSTIQPHLYSFVPPTCSDPSRIGITCNISNTPCDMIQPCENSGTCENVNITLLGYVCLCLSGFNGTQCQLDYRLCKPDTCWNNGTCKELSNKTFICQCEDGWQGTHCETKINYCEGVRCENNGVCRPLFRNYTCECLGESFSGLHCEIVATKIQIYRIISKSFSYIVIISLISVCAFIVIMDILKYGFGIDPVKEERERLQRQKRLKKRKPIIQRFIYVNPPT